MFLDDVEASKNKVIRASRHDLDTAKNGVLSSLKHVLIPMAQLELEHQKAMDTIETNGVGYTNGDTLMGTSAAKGAAFMVEVDGKCHTFSSYLYSKVEQSLADGSIPT